MPRRVDDFKQPSLGPTASDLGEEAYRANLSDQPGRDVSPGAQSAGTVPVWKRPEAENLPPGQHRDDAQEVKIGEDLKRQGGVGRNLPT